MNSDKTGDVEREVRVLNRKSTPMNADGRSTRRAGEFPQEMKIFCEKRRFSTQRRNGAKGAEDTGILNGKQTLPTDERRWTQIGD
jgi:hypothetical protein